MPYTPNERREVIQGFLSGVVVSIIVVGGSFSLAALTRGELFWLILYLPAVQWIFVCPAMAILRAKGRYGLVEGLFYAAMVSMVVTLVFWFWIFSHIDI